MKRELEIRQCGAHVSVQDTGRRGRQWLGIPEGGALDRDALAIANALVGNPVDVAAAEICLGNFSCILHCAARVALAGTDAGFFTATMPQSQGGREYMLRAGRSVDLPRGSVITLGNIPDSNSAMMAFSGGIATAPMHGSRSASPAAHIGAFLQAGDVLPLGADPITDTDAQPQRMLAHNPFSSSQTAPPPIRCVRGPHDGLFTPDALQKFFSTPYRVTPAMNRMGMRLQGAVLRHRAEGGVATTGVTCGAVQVPGDGMPILLLADHQTTGGYANIACVISADLPRLARLKPHDTISFAEVSVADAEAAAQEHAATLAATLAGLAPAPPLAEARPID